MSLPTRPSPFDFITSAKRDGASRVIHGAPIDSSAAVVSRGPCVTIGLPVESRLGVRHRQTRFVPYLACAVEMAVDGIGGVDVSGGKGVGVLAQGGGGVGVSEACLSLENLAVGDEVGRHAVA